jgi:large subunit ribosomal protein L13
VDILLSTKNCPIFATPKLIKLTQVNPLSTYKTISANKNTITKNWVVVDAAGQPLGRLASKIATIIRGKHKPAYSPHVDCGDHVIVINASHIKLTGAKMDQKEYIRHTGFPGGQRVALAKAVKKDRIVESAIRGMLPKNRLGRKLFNNLFVYEGSEHPHAAQQPKELKFDI